MVEQHLICQDMKSSFLNLVLCCLVLVLFNACTAIEAVFKAGMIWGIFLVVLVVGAIIALILRAGKK